MKAKKTSPKSVRFDKELLDVALDKSGLQSIQELVDLLIRGYTSGVEIKPIEKKENKTIPIVQPTLSKQEKFQQLNNLINNKPTKNYFGRSYLDGDIELDGISKPDLPF